MLFASLLASSLLIQAPPPPRETPPQPSPMLALTEYLQLSPDQISKIHSSLQQHQASLARKRHAEHLAQVALADALRDPSTPDSKLRELNERASSARFEELVEAHALLKENSALLSPEQAGRLRTALPVMKALEARPPSPRKGGDAASTPPPPGEEE